MTTKEMSDFINSLWCWARCTEEEQRKLSEIADYLSNQGNEKNDCISIKAVLDAIDSKAWEFCDYLISKGRNDEQKPVSHFADNLREYICEELPSVTPQESILDNIRSDIKAYTDSQGFINISEYRFNGIIDKYKAESEK